MLCYWSKFHEDSEFESCCDHHITTLTLIRSWGCDFFGFMPWFHGVSGKSSYMGKTDTPRSSGINSSRSRHKNRPPTGRLSPSAVNRTLAHFWAKVIMWWHKAYLQSLKWFTFLRPKAVSFHSAKKQKRPPTGRCLTINGSWVIYKDYYEAMITIRITSVSVYLCYHCQSRESVCRIRKWFFLQKISLSFCIFPSSFDKALRSRFR